MKRTIACLLLCSTSLLAQSATAVRGSIPVPGPVRWDYVSVDPLAHRLYVAHSDRVDVVDLRSDKPLLQLAPTPGVHGAAVARDVDRVFTSNGAADALGVFDLRTGRSLQTVKVGHHPDAIVYDPSTRRVFTFNGRSDDVTAVDARTLQVLAASIPVGGTPEYAVSDGHGHVYFNIEDKGELAVMDARTLAIVRRYSLAPCQEPSGLAIDPKGRLYSVCRNAVMVVSDPSTGRVIGQAEIGHGADGVAWMDGKAWSANGRDASISVVEEVSPGEFRTVATVPTARGARTIAADPVLHELFSPTADFPANTAQGNEPPHRPRAIAGTFRVLVIGAGSTAGATPPGGR